MLKESCSAQKPSPKNFFFFLKKQRQKGKSHEKKEKGESGKVKRQSHESRENRNDHRIKVNRKPASLSL